MCGESCIRRRITPTKENKIQKISTGEFQNPTILAGTYNRGENGIISNLNVNLPFRAVDVNEMQEVQCVVETYNNGTSWYRVWSDGWCEQGGISPSGGDTSTQTVTLLKAFSNTDYNVVAIQRDGPAGNYTNGLRILNYTTASFQINYRTGGTTTAYWKACGYTK